MVSWTRSKQLIFLPADRGRQVWGSVSSFRGEQRENICWVWCFRLVNYRAAGLATSGGLCKSGKLVILATCFFSSRISTSSGATDMTAADNSGRGRWRAGLHIATWFEMIFFFWISTLSNIWARTPYTPGACDEDCTLFVWKKKTVADFD